MAAGWIACIRCVVVIRHEMIRKARVELCVVVLLYEMAGRRRKGINEARVKVRLCLSDGVMDCLAMALIRCSEGAVRLGEGERAVRTCVAGIARDIGRPRFLPLRLGVNHIRAIVY